MLYRSDPVSEVQALPQPFVHLVVDVCRPVDDVLFLCGWAVDDFGRTADKIEVLKGELVVGTLVVNRARPDVAAAIPQWQLSEAGFEGTVPWAAVAQLPSINLRLTFAGIEMLRRVDLASRQVSLLH